MDWSTEILPISAVWSNSNEKNCATFCCATADTLSVWKYYSYIFASRETWAKYYLLRADKVEPT